MYNLSAGLIWKVELKDFVHERTYNLSYQYQIQMDDPIFC